MIELLLARQGYRTMLMGDSEFEVKRVRMGQQRTCEPGTLAIVNGKQPAEQRDGDACAYLYAKLEPRETQGAPARQRSAHAVSAQGDHILEDAYETMLALEKWDTALKDALLTGTSFDEFIELGAATIGRPLAYFDRNLITLASSSDYWKREEVAGRPHAHLNLDGQMPPHMAVDLVEDIDYLNAAEERGGFYYKSMQHRVFYGINTFDNGEYLARLVVSLGEGEQRLHRGEEQLIDTFHARLDDLHLRYAGSAQISSSQNDSLHALVHAELTGAGESAHDEAAAILGAFGWAYDDCFVVAKLVFFEGVHWDTVSLYLCNLLERVVNGSCAFPGERQITWMMNLSQAARPAETYEETVRRVTESLVAILRNYACKAGLSDTFNSFSEGRDHFVEAERALEVGQVRDPHYWYYRFPDYAFDYLMSQCANELKPQQTCHPALAKLAAYDALHATEYARTLVSFLRNSQNTTHAAAELYIHRTSFMRRMAHMEKLADFNLSDSDQVLHLLLSAKLLGI